MKRVAWKGIRILPTVGLSIALAVFHIGLAGHERPQIEDSSSRPGHDEQRGKTRHRAGTGDGAAPPRRSISVSIASNWARNVRRRAHGPTMGGREDPGTKRAR